MRSRLNSIVLCDYCVHSFTVWYLLFPHCLHLTISRSFWRIVGWSVFLCWSFTVFIRWLIRVSLLIVCHIHSLADPYFSSDRLSYSFVGWSVVLCLIPRFHWLIRISRLIIYQISRFHWFIRISRLIVCHIPRFHWLIRISRLIVCHLLLPLIVYRSWSFAVYFCRWSFVVPDRLPFAFAADRLSLLIV